MKEVGNRILVVCTGCCWLYLAKYSKKDNDLRKELASLQVRIK